MKIIYSINAIGIVYAEKYLSLLDEEKSRISFL